MLICEQKGEKPTFLAHVIQPKNILTHAAIVPFLDKVRENEAIFLTQAQLTGRG